MTDTSSHRHGLDNISGYVAVATYAPADGPVVRDDIVRFSGASSYAEALDSVRALRKLAGPRAYAVVDTLHSCGCRSQG
jgi:hypothetical protein